MKNLKKERVLREMSQSQVAEIIGVSQSNYSKYEKGTLYPTIETLIKLADFYNVSTDYLLDRVIYTK